MTSSDRVPRRKLGSQGLEVSGKLAIFDEISLFVWNFCGNLWLGSVRDALESQIFISWATSFGRQQEKCFSAIANLKSEGERKV